MLPTALGDLVEARDWYDARQKGVGSRFLDAFDDAWKSVVATPLQFAIVETIGGREFRRAPVAKFPYDIVFEIRRPVLLIVAVSHHHRSRDYWHTRVESS
jgi:hypothetical protein